MFVLHERRYLNICWGRINDRMHNELRPSILHLIIELVYFLFMLILKLKFQVTDHLVFFFSCAHTVLCNRDLIKKIFSFTN